MEHEAVAVRGEHEGNVERRRIVEALLHAVADAVGVVLGLDQRERDVRLVVENDVGLLGLAAVTSLPRTMIRPLVKQTSSRTCTISSQPARLMAGRMNFVQMSRSVRLLLSIPHEPSPSSRTAIVLRTHPCSRATISDLGTTSGRGKKC